MSIKLATVAVVMTIVFVPAAASHAAQADEKLLATLRPGHPRLFVTPESMTKLREAATKDGLAKDYFRAIEQAAIGQLDTKPAERVLTGPRLLFVSRATLKRLETLGLAYLITGERRYADRAIKEMRAVAAFSDWNPSHFLDVGEMTAAMGIGYDWCYDAMTEDDRKVVRDAIVKHGMNAGLEGYRKPASWATRNNNWAQVCHGGLTIGALAIADAEPQVARDVIIAARDALRPRMNFWAPDGGFVEGPGYWGYATMYAVYYLAALETALGNDFGFSNVEGFSEAGVFRIQSVGSSGLPFNYADAGEHLGRAPQMFWMARRYDRPEYAANERRLVGGNPDPFDLIWLDTTADATTRPALPKSALFRGVNVATFRNTWDESSPEAIFVAVKGGDNKASHGHLDLGSFVLDFGKRRWVSDPGADDYNLPAYFGKLRWTYYHCNTEGQNTLMLDGENQVLDAKAQIIAFADKSDGQLAVVDLSAAYAPKAKRVRRGVGLGIDNTVIVQDEIEAAQPVDFAWGMHTNAKVEISADGLSAVLTQGDERLHVTVAASPGAKFEVKPVTPPPPQRERKGMSKLILRSTEKITEARIVVYFSREPMKKAGVTTLDRWIDFAKQAP